MIVAGFSDFFKGLLGAVRNGRENRDDDVKQVKRGLGSLGYWDEPAHGLNGILDRELDAGIRDFQSDHDLKVDGWMKPGGATEEALKTRLASTDRLRYPDIRVKPGRSWQSKAGAVRGARSPSLPCGTRRSASTASSATAPRASMLKTARRRHRSFGGIRALRQVALQWRSILGSSNRNHASKGLTPT
jgi:hypothetical protein